MTACFNLLNTAYFTNIINQINSAGTPEELQAIIDTAFSDIQNLESTMTGQLALLAPINILLTAPGANLTALATWISTFITSVLTPIYKPYITMTAQLAELAVEVSAVIAAAEAAAEKLKQFHIGFELKIPTISANFCTI
jgi:hypothetical protein